MKHNKELNQQVLNTAVDKKGRPTINIDKRKSIYSSIDEALKAIPITNRNVGLTIPIYNGIKIVEYWWEKGIKDSDLVKKINGDDIPRIDSKLVDLQNQIDGINNIEFKVFDSLPEIGESSIIYVIPNTVSAEDNDFIEYFWIKSQQRYERFGGLNVDGGVTINNFYKFDNNVFTIDEGSNIKNVRLNSKKIAIGDKSIEIYRYDIGEVNNEKIVLIDTYSRVAQNRISYGGEIKLNGFIKSGGNIKKELQCQLYPDGLNVIYTQNEIINKASLIPQSLTIEQDINKSVITYDGIYLIEDEDNIFEVSRTKLGANVQNINLISKESFNIIIDDATSGIKGHIDLTYDNFNATFNQLIYLNAPTTKVKKVLFEENSGTDIYLEPYNETSYNVNYRGLRSESNIYIKDSNSYFIKSKTNYSLTSYGLSGIKHRDSNTQSNLGYDVLNIGDSGVLNIGMHSELSVNESAIFLQQDSNHLRAHLLIDKINNKIELKGNNDGTFLINQDGWCIMKGYDSSKIGLLGTNNENSYFLIEKNEYHTFPDVKIYQNLNNYIYLYKNDNHNNIDIKGECFNFIDNLYNTVFSIDYGSDILFKPGNRFSILTGDNLYKFILDNHDGITLGKSNKIDINDNNIKFTLGSKVITINESGISDGTNTKTWTQLLS